jgi:signal transduction histidine kinase
MTPDAGGPGPLRRLHAILGLPGLMIGVFSLVSFGFGLVVLVREYDRLRQAGREALDPAIAGWVRTAPVHYLGWTLPDYVDRWRRAGPADRQARQAELERALNVLGDPTRRSPLIEIVAMDLAPRGGGSPVASWRPWPPHTPEPDDLTEVVPVSAQGPGPALDLAVRYRPAPEVARVARGLESSYHRLLLALLGLSGYSLLCLGYMVLHARALRERVARESAQAATLDLADRTCHELGNVAFVLSNERRNLADHLALVERFVAEEPEALDAAAHRAGLEPSAAERFRHALAREHAERGIDPDVELRAGAEVAGQVCRQIAVCSNYIALTVRELDAYLKQSALPIHPEPVDVAECLDDALALLGPSLDSASARVDRSAPPGPGPRASADRRLLVHALVNLLKNAVEAASAAGRTPRINLAIRLDGPMVWIDVADNGPGIPAADQSHIFDLGYSTKGAGRGRGLGIVRESIHAQKGQLRLESRPGEGTTFLIGLPRSSEGEPTPNGDGSA